jgi:hypothetical protein
LTPTKVFSEEGSVWPVSPLRNDILDVGNATFFSDVNSPSVPYLDPQYRTGHPCTRTSSVRYFSIRYLDPKVEEM